MKHVDPFAFFKNMLKQQNDTWYPLRLLGLYVGVKRVGVVISDVESGPASACCVMERGESDIMAFKFQQLIRDLSVAGVIVGLPANARLENPADNPEAIQAEAFVDDLFKTRKLDKVQYLLWNDSFKALKGVELLLDAFPLDPIGAIQIKDKVIARGTTKMLQNYLDSVRDFVHY